MWNTRRRLTLTLFIIANNSLASKCGIIVPSSSGPLTDLLTGKRFQIMVYLHHGRKPNSLQQPGTLLLREIGNRYVGVQADGASVAAEHQKETRLSYKIILLSRSAAFQNRLYILLIRSSLIAHIVDCLRLDNRIGNCLLLS